MTIELELVAAAVTVKELSSVVVAPIIRRTAAIDKSCVTTPPTSIASQPAANFTVHGSVAAASATGPITRSRIVTTAAVAMTRKTKATQIRAATTKASTP